MRFLFSFRKKKTEVERQVPQTPLPPKDLFGSLIVFLLTQEIVLGTPQNAADSPVYISDCPLGCALSFKLTCVHTI